MQLIAMAMPRGDKCQQSNKNCYHARSGDESTDNSSTAYVQNQDGSDIYEARSHPSSLDCLLPLSVDTTLQNISRCVNITEIRSLSLITPSLYIPVLQVSSSDSLTSVHSNIEDSTESLRHQQQGNVCGNSIHDVPESKNVTEIASSRQESSCSSVVDNDDQCVQFFEATNTDFTISRQDVDNIIIPPVRTESISSEADTLEVDNNMNVSKGHSETSAHLQYQPLVDWFKLLPHADVLTSPKKSSRSTVQDNSDVREHFQTINSVEQFSSLRNRQVRRQTDAINCNQHYCDSYQKVPCEESRSYDNSQCSNTTHRAALLEFHRAEEVSTSWHGSHYSLITKLEPPVWTSLALRENTIHCPESSCVAHQCSFCQFAGSDFNFQCCALTSAYNNNNSVRTTETERQVRAGYDRLNECNSLDNYVFQNCGADNADNFPKQNLDGFDEVNSDEDVESFAGMKINVPITLNDIDYITRMLPSSHLVRDSVLNEISDDEVSMFMSHQENDDDNEELETYDVVQHYADDGRPTNPVACTLDDGGNEHFLPILHNATHDASVLDGK